MQISGILTIDQLLNNQFLQYSCTKTSGEHLYTIDSQLLNDSLQFLDSEAVITTKTYKTSFEGFNLSKLGQLGLQDSQGTFSCGTQYSQPTPIFDIAGRSLVYRNLQKKELEMLCFDDNGVIQRKDITLPSDWGIKLFAGNQKNVDVISQTVVDKFKTLIRSLKPVFTTVENSQSSTSTVLTTLSDFKEFWNLNFMSSFVASTYFKDVLTSQLNLTLDNINDAAKLWNIFGMLITNKDTELSNKVDDDVFTFQQQLPTYLNQAGKKIIYNFKSNEQLQAYLKIQKLTDNLALDSKILESVLTNLDKAVTQNNSISNQITNQSSNFNSSVDNTQFQSAAQSCLIPNVDYDSSSSTNNINNINFSYHQIPTGIKNLVLVPYQDKYLLTVGGLSRGIVNCTFQGGNNQSNKVIITPTSAGVTLSQSLFSSISYLQCDAQDSYTEANFPLRESSFIQVYKDGDLTLSYPYSGIKTAQQATRIFAKIVDFRKIELQNFGSNQSADIEFVGQFNLLTVAMIIDDQQLWDYSTVAHYIVYDHQVITLPESNMVDPQKNKSVYAGLMTCAEFVTLLKSKIQPSSNVVPFHLLQQVANIPKQDNQCKLVLQNALNIKVNTVQTGISSNQVSSAVMLKTNQKIEITEDQITSVNKSVNVDVGMLKNQQQSSSSSSSSISNQLVFHPSSNSQILDSDGNTITFNSSDVLVLDCEAEFPQLKNQKFINSSSELFQACILQQILQVCGISSNPPNANPVTKFNAQFMRQFQNQILEINAQKIGTPMLARMYVFDVGRKCILREGLTHKNYDVMINYKPDTTDIQSINFFQSSNLVTFRTFDSSLNQSVTFFVPLATVQTCISGAAIENLKVRGVDGNDTQSLVYAELSFKKRLIGYQMFEEKKDNPTDTSNISTTYDFDFVTELDSQWLKLYISGAEKTNEVRIRFNTNVNNVVTGVDGLIKEIKKYLNKPLNAAVVKKKNVNVDWRNQDSDNNTNNNSGSNNNSGPDTDFGADTNLGPEINYDSGANNNVSNNSNVAGSDVDIILTDVREMEISKQLELMNCIIMKNDD